jgi:hypothetical protein
MKQTGFLTVGLTVLVLVSASYYAWQAYHSKAIKPAAEPKSPATAPVTQAVKKASNPIVTQLQVQESNEQDSSSELSQADFDQLQTLPTQVIWDRWRSALQTQSNDASLLAATLIQKLRQGGGAAKSIYTQVAQLLKAGAASSAKQAEVIHLLGETSTPEALAVLAKLLQESTNDDLRHTIADAVAQGSSGLTEWDLKLHPELSPILEKLWQQLEPDQQVAEALAARIAREGAPSGIKLMLEQIGQDGKTLLEIQKANNPRSLAALNAMAEIRNPAALPLLKQAFQGQALDSAAFNASGNALAAMANVEATKTLLDWARQAPDAAADQAQQWLGNAAGNDPDSTLFLKNALLEDALFKSEQVKQGVLAVMKERE